MKIIWTFHAEERLNEWAVKFGIKKEDVENLVMNPEQISPGHMDVLVAQGKMFNGLLRVPYKIIENDRKVLTIYWTSKIEKYWKEVQDEN